MFKRNICNISCWIIEIFFVFYFLKIKLWIVLSTCSWENNRVSIRKTFAQFLRNETQNFSFFAHQFYAKKQQFAQSFAKVISRKIALFRFCETQVLLNSAISYQNPKQISSKSLDNFSFEHIWAYFLKVDSSGIGYFLALFYMT